MQCANCGAEVREGAPFCAECGRPVQPVKKTKRPAPVKAEKPPKKGKEPTPERAAIPEPVDDAPKGKKPKKKKKKWGWVLALVIIAALLIGAVYAWFALPAFQMMRALGRGTAESYTEAAELYSASVEGSFLETKLAEKTCLDRLDAPAEDYLADELSYEVASDFYAALTAGDSSNKLSARAAELAEMVEEKHTAEMDLAKGDEAFASGDYALAIELYGQIAEDSPAYQQAQERIAESRSKYVDSVMDEIDALVEDGKYADALHALDAASAILPDDETFTERRDAFYEEFETVMREKAEAEEEAEKEAEEQAKKDAKKTDAGAEKTTGDTAKPKTETTEVID